MPQRPVRIALFSLLSVLILAVTLPAQFGDEIDSSPQQQDPTALKPKPTAAPAQRHVPRVIPRTVYVTEMRPLSNEETQELLEYERLVKSIREAKDDAARKPLADKLKTILNAKFEREMAEREKEIKVVEDRVATLRKQQQKRVSMKDEIISLNIKTILFNAEGLDFPFSIPGVPMMFGTPVDLNTTYSVPPRSSSKRAPLAEPSLDAPNDSASEDLPRKPTPTPLNPEKPQVPMERPAAKPTIDPTNSDPLQKPKEKALPDSFELN